MEFHPGMCLSLSSVNFRLKSKQSDESMNERKIFGGFFPGTFEQYYKYPVNPENEISNARFPMLLIFNIIKQ
jgi:hypothetical protein